MDELVDVLVDVLVDILLDALIGALWLMHWLLMSILNEIIRHEKHGAYLCYGKGEISLSASIPNVGARHE